MLNENSTLTVRYKLSEKWRNEQFVSTGRKPFGEQSIQFNLLEAAPKYRKAIVDCPEVHENMDGMSINLLEPYSPKFDGAPTLDMVVAECDRLTQLSQIRKRKEMENCISNATNRIKGAIESQSLTLDRTLVDWQRDQARQHDVSLDDYDALFAEYQQRLPEFQQNADERERQAAEAEQQKQAAIDALEAEKRAWILSHGSDRLRRAYERGYSCQRQYVLERAAFEAPGFTVDYDDKAHWNERSCPSTKALNLEDKVQHLGKAETVVLTQGTQEDEEFNDEPCEAVVIREYLGKYDLIKIV